MPHNRLKQIQQEKKYLLDKIKLDSKWVKINKAVIKKLDQEYFDIHTKIVFEQAHIGETFKELDRLEALAEKHFIEMDKIRNPIEFIEYLETNSKELLECEKYLEVKLKEWK